jgi:hypothetical protein
MSSQGCIVRSSVAISEAVIERNQEEGKEEDGPGGRGESKYEFYYM